MNGVTFDTVAHPREFAVIYGQAARDEFVLDIPERGLRNALIAEEVQELLDALENEDLVETVDALADIVYVTAGSVASHGAVIAPVSVSASCLPTTVGPQEFKHYAIGAAFATAYYFGLYQRAKTQQEVQDGLQGLVFTCFSLAASLGVDLVAIYNEVHRSNLSKLGEDGKPIKGPNGKVLKGPNFFVPDIAAMLVQSGFVIPPLRTVAEIV